MLTGIVVILLLLIAVYFISRPRALPDGYQLPPGPKQKPLVGNLTDIPPYHSWLQFEKWSKTFGPLYCLNIAGRNNIIVSREDIANDLLRERGTMYSSREQLPMAAQLMSKNLRPLFLPYGNTWREVRKLMHALANTKISESYIPVQEEESLRLVHDLIQRPTKYETWFERYSSALILRLAYSKQVYTGEESYVKRILAVVHNVERTASPGAYLVDTFPFLMYLPSFMAPFKKEATLLHKEEKDLFRTLLFEGVDSGESNFCTKWHENKDQYKISEDHVAYTIGTLFEAGAGTTAAAMLSWMLAMVLHPAELEKLQAEIDNVVGEDRLPSLDDMPKLPRVRAVAKETLRWRPVTAGGLPHMLVQDDVYELDSKSYFLPAGSNIHPVQWSIHRDAELYPDPDSFRPERWLEEGWPTFNAQLDTYPNLQNYSAFGHGRRICPGQNIAERSLYILIARIAWGCAISKKVVNGEPITPPQYDYVTGFNVQPKPFDFELKARSKKINDVIETEYFRVWNEH